MKPVAGQKELVLVALFNLEKVKNKVDSWHEQHKEVVPEQHH